MYTRFFTFFLFFAFSFSINLSAQIDQKEVIFIITNGGDSILTSKIFSSKTNEDQVTFLLNGARKTYQASEVKSYFKKSRRYSIFINSEGQHKLAQILVRGTYKLARSFSAQGDEKFYLLVNQEWKNLDPYAFSLNEYLVTLLPDLDQIIGNKKIHYNARSLGKAISKYSKIKNPSYRISGYPGYTDKFKFGCLGTFGMKSISTNNFFINDFNNSFGFNLGLGAELSYSRLFSMKFQIVYAQNRWNNTLEILRLNTINFAPLWSVEVFRPSRNFGLSASVGPNFIFAKNLKIDEIDDRYNQVTKLNPVNIGYDFQVEASFGRSLELILSYQFDPSVKTLKRGVTGSRTVNLRINTFRAGILYYFVN